MTHRRLTPVGFGLVGAPSPSCWPVPPSMTPLDLISASVAPLPGWPLVELLVSATEAAFSERVPTEDLSLLLARNALEQNEKWT
jgi:hypothetical protein